MSNKLQSRLHFLSKLPPKKFWLEDLGLFPESTVLIVDKKLRDAPQVKSLAKIFNCIIYVSGGEKVKAFSEVERLAEKILDFKGLVQNVKQMAIISIGGGSIGDAIGFLASIYKRGVRWVNIPTTWLSVVDSAHGGKTAVNVKGLKNQLGQFYSPSDVVISQPLLSTLPKSLAMDAMGEVAKTVLLKPDDFKDLLLDRKPWTGDTIWKALPQLIDIKLDIVKQDPFEDKKIRYLLNWGHTFGHIFEGQLGKSHGQCVGQGLLYEIYLSHLMGKLSESEVDRYFRILNESFSIKPEKWASSLSKSKFLRWAKNDKKANSEDKVNIVIAKNQAKFMVVPISVDSLWDTYKNFTSGHF
tara:strand:- start:35492 stop:36556 length:1065 start_codon:yes stop_codon:yes gene_type:complete